MAKFVPNARIIACAPLERLSKCEAALKQYASDVEVINVRAKTGYEMLQGFKRLRKDYAEVRVPLLVLHGDGDEITDRKAAENFVRCAGSVDKKFLLLPGTGHLVLHEPDQAKVMGMMRQFMLTGTTKTVTAADTTPPGGSAGVGAGGLVDTAVPVTESRL